MKIESQWNKQRGFVANVNGIKVQIDHFDVEASPFKSNELRMVGLCETVGHTILDQLHTCCHSPKSFKIEAECTESDVNDAFCNSLEVKYLVEGQIKADDLIRAAKRTDNLLGGRSTSQILLNGKCIHNSISK